MEFPTEINGVPFTKIMQKALEISEKEQEQKEERDKSIVVLRYRESNIRNREEGIEEELNFANKDTRRKSKSQILTLLN